ncbi:neuronal acetylcholine receptor subunit alpha-7-like [Corythoichthys intestinalis]|uniref:neuronal acetylcholine receptor subunit alpha-7-like n=1 Tax=Corythoichthys intestinalis TaxID=161448 RepID=UPI0025A5BBCC|nr:neuronal acetylcholine receptor subunit alpha-7-like [Corythoichthys intestinalis]XP_061811311.1 neuronal acetylcholine receptor subunit alpha-7-like [Nerophis lumbriciformis]
MDSHEALLFLLVSAYTLQVSMQGPDESRLYHDLFSRYQKLERPVLDESQILNVEVGIHLNTIMDLDEKNQALKTNIWMHMNWKDYKLQWNESDYNGLDKIRVPDDLLWKPDILLYNSADENFDPTSHTKIVVDSSGSCLYIPPAIIKSTCNIDVRWFPFDVQKCDLKFGSWTYGGSTLDLSIKKAEISEYIPNVEWDLVAVSGNKHTIYYECCPDEPYYDITFTIVMRRRTLFYALNLLIPCIVISILSLFVFLLPADSGEKISLAITVLLSLVVLMLMLSEIMPASSDSAPLLSLYIVITMVIVALSVISTVVVLQFHHHDPNGAGMPKWVRIFLFNWCAWFLRMKRPGQDKGQSSPTSMDPKARLESVHPASSDSGKAGEGEVLLTKVPSSKVSSFEPELANILSEVHYIAKCFHDQQKGGNTGSDWKFGAAVIDRLCFVIFFVFIFLCTFGILMSVPNAKAA